jgi:hypothetical protein
MITENATFNGTEYEANQDSEDAALNFFAAGRKDQIPQAKYDAAEAEPIPGMKAEKD